MLLRVSDRQRVLPLTAIKLRIPPFEKGGFEAANFPRNPPGSPFVKGGSQSLNLMALVLPLGTRNR